MDWQLAALHGIFVSITSLYPKMRLPNQGAKCVELTPNSLSLGVFGGFLLDAGSWRWTVGGGSVLYVFTFFMLSLCRPGQYAPIILSQG